MDWLFKLNSTISRCLLGTNEMFRLNVATFAFNFVVKSVVILVFIYLLSHPLSQSCPSSHLLTTCFAHSEISAQLKIFGLRCGHHELLEFLCKLLEIVDCSGVKQTA